MGHKYTPRKVVAVDVDDTLVIAGTLNVGLVEWCKAMREDGYRVYLWSARGERHALSIVQLYGLSDVFDKVMAKPSVVVDDQGWGWVKYTKVIRPEEFADRGFYRDNS